MKRSSRPDAGPRKHRKHPTHSWRSSPSPRREPETGSRWRRREAPSGCPQPHPAPAPEGAWRRAAGTPLRRPPPSCPAPEPRRTRSVFWSSRRWSRRFSALRQSRSLRSIHGLSKESGGGSVDRLVVLADLGLFHVLAHELAEGGEGLVHFGANLAGHAALFGEGEGAEPLVAGDALGQELDALR